MSSKNQERLFLDRMLKDLGWIDADVLDGHEPPDFLLVKEDGRVAVEITRVYRRETTKGSPDAAQETEYDRFASDLAEAYYADPAAPPVQVNISLPAMIRSPAVRQWSREDRKQNDATVSAKALIELRNLPAVEPWSKQKFKVEHRDGRPCTFWVLALPPESGMERRWKVLNNTIGTRGLVAPRVLQDKIKKKGLGLTGYRDEVEYAVLLVVANAMRASGFLELPADVAVNAYGFDAVYFQRYMEPTLKLPLL
jgi:hypothetical protein